MELSGREFLDFCRRDSFREEIDQEITRQVGALIAQLPLESPETEQPREPLVKQQTQALDKLWVLKNAYIEIQTLKELGEFLPALEAIEKLKVANTDFSAKYPGSLLCQDIELQLETTRQELYTQIQELWSQDIRVEATKIHMEPALQEHWELYEAAEPHLQLQTAFMTKFSALINHLVSLEVADITESDTSISLEMGPTKTVEMLVDNVQNFFLAFSSVCPAPLYKIVARKQGHSFVKDLIAESLPRLSPTNPQQITEFKSEIQGIRGLQELLASIEWSNTHILADYADNFQHIWTLQREAVYLDELRVVLGTKYQADSWDWDGEDWDEQEEESESTESKPTKSVVAIIEEFSAAAPGATIDTLLALFRALAPRHYGDHIIELYAATRDLHAQVNALPYSAQAYAKLEAFGSAQLSAALDKFSEQINRVIKAHQSAETAQRVIQEVEKCAQKASAASPQVRDNILSALVEQIAVNAIRDTLVLGDITQDQSEQISAYIKGLRGLGAFFGDISEMVPSWIKLQRLHQILEQNLAGIRGMYENSMLVDFSGPELVGLIEALFVDSDAREDLIRSVG